MTDFKVGKLYASWHKETVQGVPVDYALVIICTRVPDPVLIEAGKHPSIAGVVVKNTDPISDHTVGRYLDSWLAATFFEYESFVLLDNKFWKEPMGTTQG